MKAARSLLRAPAFTLVSVAALALGIAATTTILSVINGVLLRPLPYAHADRLVVALHGGTDPVAPANFLDWRAQTRSFSDMAAAESWSANLTGPGEPESVRGLRVSSRMFPMLGVAPLLGRTFERDDKEVGAAHDVVISYSLWQRHFARSRNAIGATLGFDGVPYTVIGVMPASFRFAPFWATHAEVWAPLPLAARADSREGQSLRVFARLAPRVSLAQARAELAAVTTRLEREHPGSNRDVRVVPLSDMVVGNLRIPLLVLSLCVAFVLLTACANVAHLMLARSMAKSRELAVRGALGASPSRLAREALAESGLLAMAGGVLGLALAAFATRAVVAAAPAIIPRVANVSLDWRVAAAACVVTALTAVGFGLVPARRAARTDLASIFAGGSRAGGSRSATRLRSALVCSEIALALILLAGSALMIRSFTALRRVDAGFDPRNVLTLTVSTAGSASADSTVHAAFLSAALARVRTLPGVESASYINHLPLAGDMWGVPFRIEGRPAPRPGDASHATYRVVFPDYFRTMRLPIVHGRAVSETDRADATPVVVINEFTAKKYWPNENPVGHRIALGDSTWITIVGVSKNAVRDRWGAPPAEEMYFPFQQQHGYVVGAWPRGDMTMVVRVACPRRTCDATTTAPAIRAAIHDLDAHVALSNVQTLSSVVADATADTRFYLGLLSIFAVVALTLASLGIYGVISFAVSSRTREIGIRLALGATPAAVRRAVLAQGIRMTIAGAAIGLAGAIALGRLMRQLVFGVTTSDPTTYVLAALVLGAIALVASYVPARRATRLDPAAALRVER